MKENGPQENIYKRRSTKIDLQEKNVHEGMFTNEDVLRMTKVSEKSLQKGVYEIRFTKDGL